MATVPTFDRQTQQTRAINAPTQRLAITAADRAPHARDLQQISNTLSNVASQAMQHEQRMADREDADAVFRATVALRSKALEYQDEQRRSRQGAYAKGLVDDFDNWHQEQSSEQAATLTNERQKRLFQEQAYRTYEAGRSQLGRFQEAQLERSLQESWAANKVITAREAISDPTPENVSTSEASIRRQNAFMAAQKGHPPEWLEQENTKDLTLMHTTVVASLADNNAKEAKAYYMQHRDTIAPEKRAAIEDQLDTAGLLEATQERADDIMTQGLGLSEAMAHIEKNFSGEDEKSLKTEVISRMSAAKAQLDEAQQQAYDEATLLAVQGQPVKPSLLARMSKAQQAGVIKTQRAEVKRRAALASGKTIKTDPVLYSKLRQMATDEPGKFAKLNLEQYVDKLAGKELETLLDRKDAIKKESSTDKKDKAKATKESYLRTWTASVTQRGKLLGLEGEDLAGFEMKADDALREAEARTGAPLDDQGRTKLLDRMILSGEIDSGAWWKPDPDRMFYEVQGTEDESKFVPDIDSTEREKIEAALTRAGRQVTDEAVMSLFRRKAGL